MERSEPTLVPGWLKSSGSGSGTSGGTTNHQFGSSSLHSDDHVVSKLGKSKLSVNTSDHDLGKSSVSDRTTSSYFRRSPNSNGSAQLRSYSSFGRSHRVRDWDKDGYEYRDKEKPGLGDHRHRDYFDPLGNILPSRFEKDGLRRSQSMISGKRGEPWPRKVTSDLSSANKNIHNNGNTVLVGASPIRSVHKAAFERDFPSLGAEERRAEPEIGRVPSPGLSTAIQSLPIGPSTVIGGDGWTSALAEVPVIVGSNGTGTSSSHANSASVASSTTTGLNMAETLAQGPSRVQTTPQLSVETQRLEELAIKQSRQLIPVTPAKTLVSNPSEKPKLKVGQHQHQVSSSLSPHGGPLKPDISKTSSVGKLHVLKPARERNGGAPVVKDSLSPTSVSKASNSPLTVAPSAVGSVPLRNPSSNPIPATAERKPALPILEKRPTSQTQSRNVFFSLLRKQSMTNSSSPAAAPDSCPVVSPSVSDKAGEPESAAASAVPQARDAHDKRGGDQVSGGRGELTPNGDGSDGPSNLLDNGKNDSSSDVILPPPEEEEAAFLRSLGWEENAGEDEGLTEEEINAFKDFYMGHKNSRPPSRNL